MAKTFKQLYIEEVEKPTPFQLFIKQICEITHRSEHTVRMWVRGSHQPDNLTKATLAKHFGCTVQELFPEN